MTRLLVAIAALLALTGPAAADPLTIGVAILVNIGYTGTITAFGATLLGSVVLGAGAFGLQYLANALAPKPTPADPQDRQQTVRQGIGPRMRYYGRVKVSGQLMFYESRAGVLYAQIAHNHGEISGVIEYWLKDQLVATDVNGFVLTPPYDSNVVQVVTYLGTAGQTASPLLTANFTEITSSHRLRGVANSVILYGEVPREDVPKVYPNGQPGLRLVIDASLCMRPREGTTGWSQLAADVIYDYLIHPDGGNYPTSQIDLASFQAHAALCDENVALKAGGTEKRYRIWGGYALNEEMRTVLDRFLGACASELYMTSAGKIAIRGGKWVAPTVTITEDDIIDAAWTQGSNQLAAFNELTISFLDPGQDYQEVEGETWIDTANVALRGYSLPSQASFSVTPSHATARRLGKIHTHKSNPRWQGTIKTNFAGFDLVGQETVTIVFPDLSINETFAITSLAFLDDFTGVELRVSSLSEEAFDWDAATEEGDAPELPPDTATDANLPYPADLALNHDDVILLATWTPDARSALDYDCQFQEDPSGSWFFMNVDTDKNSATTTAFLVGVTYNVRVRTKSPGGAYGDWSPIESITIT